MLTIRENHAQEVNGAQWGTVESPAKRRAWRQRGWAIHMCMYIYKHILACTYIFICHTMGIKNKTNPKGQFWWYERSVRWTAWWGGAWAGCRDAAVWCVVLHKQTIFPRTNECKLARKKKTNRLGINRGLQSLEQWGYEISQNGFRNFTGLGLTIGQWLTALHRCTLYLRPEKSANISVSPSAPPEKTC